MRIKPRKPDPVIKLTEVSISFILLTLFLSIILN